MDDETKELVIEAVAALRRGDIETALLVLDRTIYPKFESVEHAAGAYAMFNGDGPIDQTHNFFAKGLGYQIAAVA